MEVNWLVWCQKNTPQNLILSLSCQLTAALGSDSQVLPIRRRTVCTIPDRKYVALKSVIDDEAWLRCRTVRLGAKAKVLFKKKKNSPAEAVYFP